MGKNINNFSLASRGLKYKLKISFYLMSILPLLVCIYLVSTYIMPRVGLKPDVAFAIGISIFIAIVGFFVIKEVFDRIVSVTSEAKLIAAGDITRKLDVEKEDEVGDLGEALNQLTQRIRSNMDELKNYGEKTTEINLEIQKRVMVLSSLLQISSLISQNTKLDEILKLIIEKARLLANSDSAFLLYRDEGKENFYMKSSDGMNSAALLRIRDVSPEESVFRKAITSNKPFLLDRKNAVDDISASRIYEEFGFRNALALPVYLRGRVMAILGVGNSKESFLYSHEDVELLDVFAKQVAIAVENDILMHRVEKLEIKDALTGLYNEIFIKNRLQEEIKRAIVYQRPCAFIVLDIDNFNAYRKSIGSLFAESSLKRIASLIKESVSEIDRVGRTGDNEFSLLLPEKNKRQAQEIAEDIRRKIEFVSSEETDPKKKITISGGVSENPLDGVTAEELITKARDLLKVAKERGRNRIVGFKEQNSCP